MTTLKWLRVPGDVIFALGIGCLAVFFFKLWKPSGVPGKSVDARTKNNKVRSKSEVVKVSSLD